MKKERHNFPNRTMGQNDDGLTRWVDEETYENYFNLEYMHKHPSAAKKADKSKKGPRQTQQDPYTVAQNFIDRTEFTFK